MWSDEESDEEDGRTIPPSSSDPDPPNGVLSTTPIIPLDPVNDHGWDTFTNEDEDDDEPIFQIIRRGRGGQNIDTGPVPGPSDSEVVNDDHSNGENNGEINFASNNNETNAVQSSSESLNTDEDSAEVEENRTHQDNEEETSKWSERYHRFLAALRNIWSRQSLSALCQNNDGLEAETDTQPSTFAAAHENSGLLSNGNSLLTFFNWNVQLAAGNGNEQEQDDLEMGDIVNSNSYIQNDNSGNQSTSSSSQENIPDTIVATPNGFKDPKSNIMQSIASIAVAPLTVAATIDQDDLDIELIEKNATEPTINKGKIPLQIFLAMLKAVGVLRIRKNGKTVIQALFINIPFGTILGIVILYNILAIIDNTQLGNIINGTGDVWMYITLGYNFAQVLVRLFFCITINCLIKRIDAVVATAKPLPNSTVSKYGVKISQEWLLCVLLAVLTTLTYTVQKVQDISTINGEKTGYDDFVSKYLAFNAKSLILMSGSRPGNMTAGASKTLGVLGAVGYEYSILVDLWAVDFIGILIASLYVATMSLNIPDEEQSTIMGRSYLYLNCKQLRLHSKLIRKCIGMLYPAILSGGILNLAMAYNYAFDPEAGKLSKLLIFLQVTKVAITLFMAASISVKVEDVREWIYDQNNHFANEPALQMLEDELAAFPIGIGRGTLYIDVAFIINCVGVSIAYFLSIVEAMGNKN